MSNVKLIQQGYPTGNTIYCIIERDTDSFLCNDADGSFSAAPADPYISLTEHGTIKGLYELRESRTTWNDGLYNIAIYNQVGGAPAPVSDTLIGFGNMEIDNDLEITLSTITVLSSISPWNSLLSGYTTAGTFGELMNTANVNFGLGV